MWAVLAFVLAVVSGVSAWKAKAAWETPYRIGFAFCSVCCFALFAAFVAGVS